jgi:hypothetical protein
MVEITQKMECATPLLGGMAVLDALGQIVICHCTQLYELILNSHLVMSPFL